MFADDDCGGGPRLVTMVTMVSVLARSGAGAAPLPGHGGNMYSDTALVTGGFSQHYTDPGQK